MPNAINPDDYNIDNLNTGFLGPILTTDFRDYVLSHNLQDINPIVVQGGYNLGGLNVYAGDLHQPTENVQDLPDVITMSNTTLPFLNNSSPYESNQIMNLWATLSPYSWSVGGDTLLSQPAQGKETYVVTTKSLENPGDVGIWSNPDGSQTTVSSIREKMIKSREQYSKNSYGPDYLYAYNCPNVPPEETGFIQYKTFAGGDFRSTILGQQLGFGPAAGIEYDSDLSDIGKEQRKFNIKERIKLNFIGDTLGSINADPFGILAGQDLITRDYTITRPPGFGGKAAAFAASLIGFNIPTSIIPSWKSAPGNNGEDISNDLLNYTANSTKSLIFNAIELNKWGPNFNGNEKPNKVKTKVGKFIEKVGNALEGLNGAGQPPGTIKYTDVVETTTQIEDSRTGSGDSLVEKLNKGVKNLVDGLIAGQEDPTIPTESTNPGVPTNPIDGDEAYGFNTGYNIMSSDSLHQEYHDGDVYGSKSSKFVTKNDINIGPEAPLPSDGNLFYWDKNRTSPTAKRGLLDYTQKLIQKSGNHGAKYIGIANSVENINLTKNNRHKVWSQGNRITVGEGEDKVFCRSWSLRNPYSKYEDTIRHSSLTNREQIFNDLSVLEDNGMPKIVPYKDEYWSDNWSKSLHSEGRPSKYMLSIENLAWENTREFNALPNVEKGPHGGRLMWFPPYDINFTDNTSVNWESTAFIGRSEPIYTYNNTERTGTLSFTIITDHPSSLNVLRNDTKVNLERYFAGCEDLTNTAFGDITSDEELIQPETSEVPVPIDPPPVSTKTLSYFFQNAATTKNRIGERIPGRDIKTDMAASYEVNGKNASFEADLQSMIDFLTTQDGKRFYIVVEGFTSRLTTTEYNTKLGYDRAESLRNYLQDAIVEQDLSVLWPNSVEGNEITFPQEIYWFSDKDNERYSLPISKGEDKNGKDSDDPLTGAETQEQKEAIINDPGAVNARRATVRLVYDGRIDAFMRSRVSGDVEKVNEEKMAQYNIAKEQREKTITDKAQKLANEMVNESTYFNKLKVENSFIYDSLREKVQYFHPAFHSMTPEGLNGRLNFLKQCTRQGPNIAKGEPQNMAFGKPPICVLRIGDFYHTKIVIDTVNFTYDPLQWDLNPEGIGVQPMLAKVDLNFKFIGGSSLGGPINELQNAVSFNFFANTSVYNKRKQVSVVKDGKPLDGDKGKPFGYGSFITPGQVSGKENSPEIIPTTIDVTQSNSEPDKDTTTENITEKPVDATQIAAVDAVSNSNNFNTTDPTNWTTELLFDDAALEALRAAFGNVGNFTKSVTLSISDEEKDNWDIVEVLWTYDFGNGASVNNSFTPFNGTINNDNKSATYSGFEQDTINVLEKGDFTYTFKFTLRPPIPRVGDDITIYKTIVNNVI